MRARSLVLVVALIACRQSEAPEVALLLADHDHKNEKLFAARASELGLRVVTLTAGNDAAKQRAQVEDALERGAKVLVIQPIDSHGAASYVARAHQKGAKVVAYDRAIIAPDLDYYVAHDAYRVGVLQAQAALRATGSKGNYVLLSGVEGDPVAAAITRGYKDTLAPFRGEVAVISEHHHGAADDAQRTVEHALAAHPRVDAILANNSGLARGAVQAIGAAGRANVFIAGADADPINVRYVCQGKQTIEVHKDVAPLAKAAAETAKLLYDGDSPHAGSSIQLSGKSVPLAAVRVEVITSDNCKHLLAAAR